ncbi:MAG: helix-turn-helix transcriptional regulator [Oscillibacter sp.]|nr:helix-turn-helix transcriptional regulator [Oscillibacter sp.]
MKSAFGETLRRLRIEKGLTQQQLANRLNVDRTSVTNWEIGRHMPDVATISRLAEALGIGAAALMSAAVELGEARTFCWWTTIPSFSKGVSPPCGRSCLMPMWSASAIRWMSWLS